MENYKKDSNTITMEKSAEESPDVENYLDTIKNNDVEKTSTRTRKTHESNASVFLNKIKSQIEFYFGDVNMLRDKFLMEQTKLDEGWVPMSIMLQFNMLASLSTDVDTILKAIETSDLMEISKDRKKIRRRLDKPLPLYNDEYKKAQLARTVYVKPFPQNIGIQNLKKFFEEFEPVENIIMRKYRDENKILQFKGSIFVQFKTADGAKLFVEKKSVIFDGKELIKKFSEEYSLEKNRERQEKKQKNDSKGNINNQVEVKVKEKLESDSGEFPKGAVLHLTTASDKLLWEDIKQQFINLDAKIVYVDYKTGATNGWIRFQGKDSARSILNKITDNKIKIKDFDVTCRLLEGNEEEEYLEKAQKELNASKKLKGRKNRNKKGSKKGRKRVASPAPNEVSTKKLAN